ncbi:MAG: EVE domain-containing protein, partial [Calditrichota bacterium]
VGIARVAKEAYTDYTQFDSGAKYFDPKSPEDNPRWDMVDIQAVETFPEPVTLPQLRETAGLEDMVLLRKGSRLSIQPVTEKEWKIIRKLAGFK